MALRNVYSAETWEKIYNSFEKVNFASYDYDTIKESLLQYIKLYYPEQFNDYIESSEFIAILEMFSYIAEQLAYRIDLMSHENFITTAQRKQNILRLARLISYKATRNVPARGLMKITSITTSEQIIDSQGNNLSNFTVTWNDPNNPLWKEQFFLIMNRVLTGKFGQPQKSFQIGDVLMQLYTFNNNLTSFKNGVSPFIANTGIETFNMEIVPSDLDENGPFERMPDINSQMSIIYSDDGIGDGSDYTGFLMFVKQGTLSRIEYDIKDPIPNRTLELTPININRTDVWINRVDNDGNILERWEEVETVNEQNLFFNTNKNRKKYEIESLENDRIKIIFGDGDFSDIPIGKFYIWIRQSANRSIVIQKNKVTNVPVTFSYTSSLGTTEICTLTTALTSTIQNSSPTETIDHIRQVAPTTYYAQNRMVNAQDYNTYMLKDSSILKLNTINRTFAGQPKYIDWNDASGQYENIKLFGDDLQLYYTSTINTISSTISSRSLIDKVIEPLLSQSGIINLLIHISSATPITENVISLPRRKFIEDNSISMAPSDIYRMGEIETHLEKSLIQGMLDRHWYGEPLEYVDIGGIIHAKVTPFSIGGNLPDDGRIYPDTMPRTYDGINSLGDSGSGLQTISAQDKFGLKYSKTKTTLGNGSITPPVLITNPQLQPGTPNGIVETWTLEFSSDATTIFVTSSLRGSFPNAVVGVPYLTTNNEAPIDFTITNGSTPFIAGDAFVLDVNYTAPNTFSISTRAGYPLNLYGKWDIINGVTLTNSNTVNPNTLEYDPSDSAASWIIWIEAIKDGFGDIIGFNVHHRDMKLICYSQNTKFWYNTVEQIIDSQTKNPVYDKIKILRSNLTTLGVPLGHNENYDVIGPVKDQNGETDVHSLEIIPADILNKTVLSGDGIPDNILQFEMFAKNSYEYFKLDDPDTIYTIQNSYYNETPDRVILIDGSSTIWVRFNEGSFVSTQISFNNGVTWINKNDPNYVAFGRRLIYKGVDNEGLDFMWQHFAPHTNMIDPSVTNIHDAFIITRGYYDNMMDYVKGLTNIAPTPPTPLELRNTYGYLLKNKMISDTVVMHSGKIKLLFGSLAEPQLRAKFRVVKAPTATFTDERIKNEILEVINNYFAIDNWDFGVEFFATELLGLIHQRLPTEISSVVLVPVYSINSFGSLFNVKAGLDEILQSAAKLEDIEIIPALTPTAIRQKI
jgi:hypothetical protein